MDWSQVRQLIDCSAQLRELVAPDGAEDLFTGTAVGDLVPSVDSGSVDDGVDGDSGAAAMLSDTLECAPAVPPPTAVPFSVEKYIFAELVLAAHALSGL